MGTFSATAGFSPLTDASNTMWLLYFYKQLEFHCTTFPAASLEGLTLEGEIERIRRATAEGLVQPPSAATLRITSMYLSPGRR